MVHQIHAVRGINQGKNRQIDHIAEGFPGFFLSIFGKKNSMEF